MQFKQRIIGAVKFLLGGSGNMQSLFGGVVSNGRMTRRVSAEADPYANFAGWTYFALDKIADRVAGIKFELYELTRNGDVEELTDHELLALLDRANPIMTKTDFVYFLAIFIKMWGAAPIYKERLNGKTTNLWPLRPDLLKMKQNANGDIVAWEYWVGGKSTSFRPEDVLYLKKADLKFPYHGYGAMQATALEIDADTAAVVWNKYFFENHAEPGGVLETEKVLSDETFNRLQRTWEARYKGAGNAGKMAILESGIKWHATETTGREAGYIQTREFNRDTIITMLGVPKGVAIADDVNLANAEVAARTFSKETIDPLMRLITDQLNEFLVPEFGDNLLLKYENPVHEDRTLMLEEVKAGVNMWMTVNEARDKYRLAPLDGGDAVYMSLGVAPQIGDDAQAVDTTVLADTSKMLKLVPQKVMSRKQMEIKKQILARTHFKRSFVTRLSEKAMAKIEAKVKDGQKIKVKNLVFKTSDQDLESRTPEVLNVERKAYLANAVKREKAFAIKCKKAFTDQEVECKAKLETEGLPKGKKSFSDWVDRIVSVVKFDALLKILQGEYEDGIDEGAVAVSGILGQDPIDISSSSSTVEFLKTMPDKFATAVNDTTIEALRTQLSTGVEAGESISQLADRVGSVFDTARDSRSVMIARTEVGRGNGFGRLEEMKAMGTEEQVWMAIFSNTRDTHAEAHGQTVKVGDPFDIGGYDAMYPRDGSLPPEEAINCQCSASPVPNLKV